MFTSLNHLVYGHFYTSEGFTLIRQKTLGKTERMPYTSTSSYSHNVFHPIREQKVFCTNFESIVSRRFRYCILATFPNRLALTFDLPNEPFKWHIYSLRRAIIMKSIHKFEVMVQTNPDGHRDAHTDSKLHVQIHIAMLCEWKFKMAHILINPFPHNEAFWRPWETSLLKTLWEKEKLLVTSNFSFSHSVFYPFG